MYSAKQKILENTELLNLGLHNDTDKVRSGGSIKSYLKVYEYYFKALQDKEIKLLEIGVRTGASVKTWEQYFSKAKIFGLDIDDCTIHSNDRIKILQGSQNNVEDLKRLIHLAGEFDIIIDDGSHMNEDILISFDHLFPYLKSGGIYIIEDLSNSYPKGTCGDNKLDNSRESIQTLFNKLIFEMDKSSWETCDSSCFSIHFFPSLCVIIKN